MWGDIYGAFLLLTPRVFRWLKRTVAACGCLFSMLIELAYHIWSPSYRQGDDIKDPLHKALHLDEIDEERRQKIEAQHDEHTQRLFIWPYSTHKNLHGAAVNGILAGENCRVYDTSLRNMKLLLQLKGSLQGFRATCGKCVWL